MGGTVLDSTAIQNLIAMICYMAIVIGIGVYFARRANRSSEDYFIGGRTLGPWIAAMSAEASDMSGWLLMGLPGVAYWCGIADAAWTAIGLGVGTYLNWLLVAKRLRHYSYVAGNAITLPDFFSNRFKEKKKVLMLISSLFILIFFAVYAGSCFVTCGKLFSTLFDADYRMMVVVGALVIVLVLGTANAGGLGAVIANAESIPGFFTFFGMATPELGADGLQVVSEAGAPVFGAASEYSLLTILSTVSWGLGYFGMPQVLLRFIAIRDAKELTKSRRIATVWVVISLTAAVMIGVVGRAMLPTAHLTASDAENIFASMANVLMHPLLAGIVMAGILAATISSSDSYLLIAASSLAKNIYQGVIRRDASDKQVMWISRIALIVLAVVGIVIAMDEDSVIFTIVSFAWAGFGATFGPVMLFSLFWKRTTHAGAVAGMLGGGCMVFIWNLLVRPLGGVLDIYELLPAFLFSCILIVVVSLATPVPSTEIQAEFETAKRAQ